MSNLKPLVWSKNDVANSALHNYRLDIDKTGVTVIYGDGMNSAKYATGFATIDEAKQWAWKHYNEKMQPYIKTSPTWIDVNERLPTKSGRYMVVHQTIKPVKSKSTPVDIDTYDENEKAWTFFRLGIMQEVTHWMPIPGFKESDR